MRRGEDPPQREAGLEHLELRADQGHLGLLDLNLTLAPLWVK